MKKLLVTGLLITNAILGVKVYDTAQAVIKQKDTLPQKNFVASKKVLDVPVVLPKAWEDDKNFYRLYNKKIGDRKIRYNVMQDIPEFKKVWTTWTNKKHIDKEKLYQLTDIVLKRLPHINVADENVKNLIVETAIAESLGGYYTDSSGGDYGVFQIRKNTVKTLYKWLKVCHPDVLKILEGFERKELSITENLASNIPFSIAVCITEYWYKAGPDFISHIKTTKDRAVMWKSVYNTYLGKGTVNKYIERVNAYEKILARQEKRLAKKTG